MVRDEPRERANPPARPHLLLRGVFEHADAVLVNLLELLLLGLDESAYAVRVVQVGALKRGAAVCWRWRRRARKFPLAAAASARHGSALRGWAGQAGLASAQESGDRPLTPAPPNVFSSLVTLPPDVTRRGTAAAQHLGQLGDLLLPNVHLRGLLSQLASQQHQVLVLLLALAPRLFDLVR